MLYDFQQMWDGNLGKINTLKNRIEKIPQDEMKFQIYPYREGPAVRKFEKQDRELYDDLLIKEIYSYCNEFWFING